MKSHVLLLVLVVSLSLTLSVADIPSAFAEIEINDRKIIDASTTVTSDGSTLGLLAGDRFGYYIEPIGDLDGDGVIDLAVSSFRDSNPSQHDDEGSVIIMFMNSDGTVKKTNKILHDNSSDGLGASCIDSSANVDHDVSGFESIAYLGNLINGNPTIALGAPWDNYANTVDTSLHNSGAIYLLELETTGKVISCVRIVDNEFVGTKFNPSSTKTGGDGAQLGFSLLATDLDGDGTLELISDILTGGVNNNNDDLANLWAFYLNSAGTITKATEYTSSDLGINNFWDSMSTINGGNKIAIGKASTGIYVVNFVGNTGVLSSVNLITASSVGSSNSAFGNGVTSIGDIDGDAVIDLMAGAVFADDDGNDGGNDEGVAYILFMNADDTIKEYQKISNTSEKERTGSTFLQTDDFFGNSITLWKQSGGEIIVAIGAHSADTGASNAGELYLFYIDVLSTEKKKGGSDNPPPPTFGKNANYKQIVEDGFCFNGNCADVDNYHTEFPLINATVGESSNITLKAYNPNGGLPGFKWFQIILGLEEAGLPLSYGEVLATLHIHQMEIDKIELVDKQNLIGNYTAITNIVQCSEEYTTECLELSFDFTPRDQLINNIVGINVVNNPRSSSTNYLNDGVEFHGDSLNEPLLSQVSASKGGAFYPQNRGLTELTLVSYHDDLWQDSFGYLWTSDNYKSFKIISNVPAPQKEPDLMWSAMTRINSNFADMIEFEKERALLVFDSSKLK